jgi:BCD family chlorophyll transporter-like MFS transporter
MSENNQGLSVGRNLKIALFHLGSGMADVLSTGVWNRIMIADLGVSATPVSLLVSLRYFLAPLGIWAGQMSDTHLVMGTRRLFWIWFGRALMVLSTFLLGYGTAQVMQHTSVTALDWLMIIVALVMFSLGNAFSGTTFLALIYDRASETQRGRAVGIVWTFLLLGFTVGGILFSILLPHNRDGATGISFTADDLLRLFTIAGLIFTALWFFSLLGEERRADQQVLKQSGQEVRTSMRQDLQLVWRNPAMRYFLFYLTLSMMFAFSQDPILEPFAGDVFGMSASVTNRFAAYWGGTSIVTSVLFLWLARKYPKVNNTLMSQFGVWTLVAAFAVLTISATFSVRWLVTPALLLLGTGLGMWNIGTLGLMMDLSPHGRAGTFLGFWTMVVTLARGVGVSGGGIMRDLGLWINGDPALAYGLVFGLGTVGLLVALYALNRIHVGVWKESARPINSEAVLAASLD